MARKARSARELRRSWSESPATRAIAVAVSRLHAGCSPYPARRTTGVLAEQKRWTKERSGTLIFAHRRSSSLREFPVDAGGAGRRTVESYPTRGYLPSRMAFDVFESEFFLQRESAGACKRSIDRYFILRPVEIHFRAPNRQIAALALSTACREPQAGGGSSNWELPALPFSYSQSGPADSCQRATTRRLCLAAEMPAVLRSFDRDPSA